MVPAREQRRARGRTERGHVKSIVAKSLRRELVERRRGNGTAERGRITESCIVNQHEKNVRCIRWSFHRMSKSRFGSFQRRFRDTVERLSWTRQHRPIPLRIRCDNCRHLYCGRKRSHRQARYWCWHKVWCDGLSAAASLGQDRNPSGQLAVALRLKLWNWRSLRTH